MPEVAANARELVRSFEASQSRQHGREFTWRKTNFRANASPQNLTVTSWVIPDRSYQRYGLPTYAYPLYTEKNEINDDQIIVRGYNKFFDVDEIASTSWKAIQNSTKGPYEVSSLEDGCTILISGLWDGTLLVISKLPCKPKKHGTCPEEAAEIWLEKQLDKVNKSKKNLATELRSRNVTLVAELCDDSFEEHVICYTRENAGLYLHGINANVPQFVTYAGAQVQQFAEEWGFLRQEFMVFEGIGATRAFLENTSKIGSYKGRIVKGFVIRCKILWSKAIEYEDFFFKYRIEGLYQVYHHWRECTHATVHNRYIRCKKEIALSEEYLRFVSVNLSKNPQMIKSYQEGRGVIKLREDFLREKKLETFDMAKIASTDLGCSQINAVKDIVLMSIGTLGCGKTTIAVSLSYLFQWGIVQNNDILGSNRPPRFIKIILDQLKEKPVVFADRNNAERRERKEFLEDMSTIRPEVRVIALYYVHNPRSMSNIRRITRARVISRGDNHQNILASTNESKAIAIMENFITRFQPLNLREKPDSDFHAVIHLDPTLDSIENLRTVIERLKALFPSLISKEPTSKDLEDAITYAIQDYKPNIKISAFKWLDKTVGYKKPKRTFT